MRGLKFLALFIVMLSAFCGTAFSKETVTIDKFVYEIYSNTSGSNYDDPAPQEFQGYAYLIDNRLPANSPECATPIIPSVIDIDGDKYEVRQINSNAFSMCAIEKLIIPGSIIKINEGAFSNCSSLKEVVLQSGDKVIDIESDVFKNCPIEQVSLDRNIKETYEWDDDYGWGHNTDWVRHIFGTNVRQLEIGNAVTYIPVTCFRNCHLLKSLTLPGSVKTIAKQAFKDCFSLNEVILEAGDTPLHLESEVFWGCSIKRIVLNRNINEYSQEPSQPMFGYSAYMLNVEIGPEVTRIIDFLFKNCNLESIKIPGTVETIGESAFENCHHLSEVTFEKGLTKIGDKAFAGCDKLESIKIPDSVERIGISAFSNCNNISEITLEEGLTEIDNFVFYNCDKLESIKIPETVKRIGRGAFSNCDNLSEVSLPKGLTVLESVTFANCDKVESIILPVGLTRISTSFKECDGLKTLTIPDGVKELSGTFSGCKNLKQVELPSSLEIIGEYTFSNCNNLEPFKLPINLSKIGDEAFRNCQKMSKISIPPAVKSIGKCAFAGTPLTSLYIEDSPTYITLDQIFTNYTGETDTPQLDWFHLGRNVVLKGSEDAPNMFSQCHLKNFTMSAEVTVIPEYFFSGWTEATWPGLASFKLPEGVEELKRKCFENCTGLKELILPPAVKKIGINAFIDCSLEKLMVMSPEPPQCSPYAFDDDQYANIELVVPTESFELYKSTAPWSKFAKIRGSEFTSIDSVEATDEAPVEWYDLKGLKVSGENMPAGIYLRRQGAKVEKIIIR